MNSSARHSRREHHSEQCVGCCSARQRYFRLGFYQQCLVNTTLVLLLLLLGACRSSSNYVPVEEFSQPPSERISTHRVASGETLYSIAWRYNFDTPALAQLNGIDAPYRLMPGQRLALDSKTASKMGIKPASRLTGLKSKSSLASKVKSVASSLGVESLKVKAPQPSQVKAGPRTSDYLDRWVWPTRGKLLEQYSRNSTRKRLRIAGSKGQSIVAANNGTVVYAGDGLPALGKLLIVRHEGDYLSAYAHNDRLLVANGQRVAVGQKIAELGSSGTSTKIDQLHFEIRYKGQAVNPLALLPKAG